MEEVIELSGRRYKVVTLSTNPVSRRDKIRYCFLSKEGYKIYRVTG